MKKLSKLIINPNFQLGVNDFKKVIQDIRKKHKLLISEYRQTITDDKDEGKLDEFEKLT